MAWRRFGLDFASPPFVRRRHATNVLYLNIVIAHRVHWFGDSLARCGHVISVWEVSRAQKVVLTR